MRDLIMLSLFLTFMFLGLKRPFIIGLGYIWADYFRPQHITYGFFSSFPISMMFAVAAIVVYAASRNKEIPHAKSGLVLMVIWSTWITLTCLWAEVPDAAWDKWNWAFKSVVFSAFIPFLFRTRAQIEALLLTITFSILGTILTFGAKTLISGGGYGVALGLYAANSSFGESSTLANIAVALLPLLFYFAKHSVIFDEFKRARFFLFYGIAFFCVATAIGTFARTGLVDLVVLIVLTLLGSKRKILTIVILAVVVSSALPFLGDRWTSRMNTIGTYQSDSSAMGRVGVWKWTLNYANSHPWGGGFELYLIDEEEEVLADGTVAQNKGIAFHSSYFEVLGEQGYVGIVIYALLALRHFGAAFSIKRRAKSLSPWIPDLSKAIVQTTLIYLVGASFIGVAFQPFLYDLYAVSIVLFDLASKGVAAGEVSQPIGGRRYGYNSGVASA